MGRRTIAALATALTLLVLMSFPSHAWAERPVVVLANTDDAFARVVLDELTDVSPVSMRRYDLPWDRVHPEDASRVKNDLEVFEPRLVIAIGVDAVRLVDGVRARVLTVSPNGESGQRNLRHMHIASTAGVDSTLSTLLQLVGKVGHLGVVTGPTTSPAVVQKAWAWAQRNGATMTTSPVTRAADLGPILKRMRGQVDAIWAPDIVALSDPLVFQALLQFSLHERTPLVVPARRLVERGGLLTVAAPPRRFGRYVASVLTAWLKRKPPEAEPPHGVAIVNTRIAALLGKTIPARLNGRAPVRVGKPN